MGLCPDMEGIVLVTDRVYALVIVFMTAGVDHGAYALIPHAMASGAVSLTLS